MSNATISADIISYTHLSKKDKIEINSRISGLIVDFTRKFKQDGFYGRIIQGDYIEMAMLKPSHALRIALMLKTFVKSLQIPSDNSTNNKIKFFKEHGVRLALAIAPVSIDKENELLDGEAIYLSGRALKGKSTSDKKKVIIKNTMYFSSNNNEVKDEFDTLITLLDTILSKCSAKQCEVLFYKLWGLSEQEITKKLSKNQSTISQHSTAGGWHAIEKTINYFEKYIS